MLEEIATERAASPRQVALAFLTRHDSVFTIPKASQVGHVLENAGADAVRLQPEDFRRLEEAFPLGPRTREMPMI